MPANGDAARPLRRRLSGALDDIVLTALRKEPERRYPSAGALAADVRRHLDAHAVGSPSHGLAAPTPAFARRHLATAMAVALGVAAVAIATPLVVRRSPTAVVSSSLIVLPFTPSAGDTLLLRLGRDLVSTLSVTLDGVGDIRTVEAPSIVGPTT